MVGDVGTSRQTQASGARGDARIACLVKPGASGRADTGRRSQRRPGVSCQKAARGVGPAWTSGGSRAGPPGRGRLSRTPRGDPFTPAVLFLRRPQQRQVQSEADGVRGRHCHRLAELRGHSGARPEDQVRKHLGAQTCGGHGTALTAPMPRLAGVRALPFVNTEPTRVICNCLTLGVVVRSG